MTPISQCAISMLGKVPAQLSFVFLVDLVLHLLLSDLDSSSCSAAHATHHVVELVLLVETLVELPLVGISLHHVVLIISHLSSHHVHLLLKLLILSLLHHVGLHLLLVDNSSSVHVIHLGRRLRHHLLLHILLILH